MAILIRHALRVCLLATAFLLSSTFWVEASPWFYRDWQADDGLPGDDVSGIAQTRDGYLWIATQSGLARFDGVRIQNMRVSVGRPHPVIRAMFLDAKQRLWLAQEGGLLVRMGAEETRLFTATNGLLKLQPVDLVQTPDESIWITYADGSLCRLSVDKAVAFSRADGFPSSGMCAVAVDSQGVLWFTRGTQVGVFRDGKFATLLALPERFVQVQASRTRGVWLCAGNRLLKYEEGGSAVELGRLPSDASVVRATTIFEDRSGAVWIGTASSGLFRFDGTNIAFVETSHGRIRTVTEDREGNIWVGTDGGGLNRLRHQVVQLQRKEDGLPFDTVRSTGQDVRGELWVVTQSGEVAIRRGDLWENISTNSVWPGGQATCVVTESNGVVWVGTLSRGLYRWENGRFRVLRRSNGLAATGIRSLLVDSTGDLWVAYSTNNILQRYSGGKFIDYQLPENSKPIRAMAQDLNGKIWMANLDGQLLRVDADQVVDETPRTDEPNRPIRCLLAAADGGLWIGYSALGVGHLKAGKFALIDAEQGLQDNSICSMMADNRGWIWFGSDHGIFRVPESELLDVVNGKEDLVRPFGYGKDDSLPSLQGYYGYSPGATRTRDGRILIPTHSGLAILHPDRVQTNYVKPPVLVETVAVDNQIKQVGPSYVPLVLPPTHHKIEVVFTAPCFVEPDKLQFRYKLKGMDEEWVDIDDRRNVLFPRLPAGEYEFQVAAGNSAGVWSELGAPVNFVVTPFFWQTRWFQACMMLLFTIFVAVIARLVFLRRLRRRVRRLEEENALQRERARIAQDIHDDFGACMTQISLLAELAQQHIARPQQAGEHVSQIATMSREGIKSLDEIVWAVNPRNDTLPDLLDFAGQYAVNFLQTAGIRCRIDFPDVPPSWDISSEVRHGLFLAVKEALHNVVKHSHATEVWLRATINGKALILVIEDNGRGFEKVSDAPQADGVRNMRQRLSEFGGSCAVEGRTGKGVTIRFEVPCQNHD